MTGRQELVPERAAGPGGIAHTWLETTILIETSGLQIIQAEEKTELPPDR